MKTIIGVLDRETAAHIDNLEECLAGFMLTAAMNGVYIDQEMQEWAMKRLVSKQRTPVQVWHEVANFDRKKE